MKSFVFKAYDTFAGLSCLVRQLFIQTPIG